MRVYFAFQNSRVNRDPGDSPTLELASSIEAAQRELKSRGLRRNGRIWHEGKPGSPTSFPFADRSALMLVWHRTVKEGPPRGPESPDYVWALTERGAVTSLPLE